MPEYSVKYPAVNSCSASGISNGALFNSASPATRNIIAPKGCQTTYQVLDCWANTIPCKLKVPANITGPIIDNPKAIS